jgi:hypothetical protein
MTEEFDDVRKNPHGQTLFFDNLIYLEIFQPAKVAKMKIFF